MSKYVVVVTLPEDGSRSVVGPFKSGKKAVRYAIKEAWDLSPVVLEMAKPLKKGQ